MVIIDCKSISREIDAKTKEIIEGLKFPPKLVAVTSNPDPSTVTYLNSMKKKAAKLGIEFDIMEGSNIEELVRVISKLASDKAVHGIFLTHPLPKGIDEFELTLKIPPEKDVEGRTPYNLGMLVYGREFFPPCTAEAAVRIMEHIIELRGKKVAVIGRSVTVGKPIAIMLLKKGRDATVTVCHSRTKDVKSVTLDSEIVVVAVGRAKFLKPDMIKKGTIVIDVGINVVDGKLMGDVDPEVEKIASVTPVPGGVGRVTTSILMRHVAKAAEKFSKND